MKKITMKKVLLRITTLMLVFALLFTVAGCSSSSEPEVAQESSEEEGTESATKTENGEPEEIPVIDFMLTWDAGANITSESLIFTEWGKRTGVKFNAIIFPIDSYVEKVNITIASNEIPDMMKFMKDTQSYKRYGPELFEPLDPYIESGVLKSLKYWMDKYPDIELEMRHPENSILYGFGLVQDYNWMGPVWYVDNDILKKQGMDASEIKTLEDMKNAMLALQKETGGYVTSSRLGWEYYCWTTSGYFGLSNTGGSSNEGLPLILDNNCVDGSGSGKYVFAPVDLQERYKKWIEFERWAFEQGLLHPDFITMSASDLFAKYRDRSFPMIREQLTFGYSFYDPSGEGKDAQMIMPFEVDGQRYKIRQAPHYNIGYRSPTVVSKDSKHKEAIMKAMDYMYSDEGIMFVFNGVEGVTYTKDSKEILGYKLNLVQSAWTKKSDGTYPEGLKSLGEYGFSSWWIAGAIPADLRFSLRNYTAEKKDVAYRSINDAEKLVSEGLVIEQPDPPLNWTNDESNRNAELATPIKTYLSENSLKFIMGIKPMSEWDDFVKGFEDLNYQELVDRYNNKLSEMNK